jgi:drug/metabolite transporter (DMT)-like permease
LEELCFHPPCNHPPSEFAFARFGIAALVSLPLLYKQNKEVVLAGLECGLWIALGYVSQAIALETISAGACAFICSMTVVFVPVVSALVYGKSIRATDILAGVIALSGVAILEGVLDFNAILGIPVPPAMAADGVNGVASINNALASSSLVTASAAAASAGPIASVAASLGLQAGDLIALGQPIGFGFAFTRIEHHQSRLKHVPNRVLTIAAAQCVTVGLLSTLWVLYDYDFTFPNFGYLVEPHRIATLLWTGIVTTVFAIYLQGTALQKASATDASIAFSSEPVWASMFGYLLLGERLGMNAYVGGTIIMMACLLGALSDLGGEPEPSVSAAQDNDTTAAADDAIDVDFQSKR